MKLLIIGSCVSRDVLDIVVGHPYELVAYHARSSLAVLSSTVNSSASSISSYLNKIESPFQRRMVEYDVSQRILSSIVTREFDVVLWDLIDERFWVATLQDGQLATRSNEFRAANIPIKSSVDTHTEEFFSLWCAGVDRLIQTFRLLERKVSIVLQKSYWTNQLDNGLTMEEFSDERILKENSKLEKMYKYLEQYQDIVTFIDIPEHLLKGQSNHKWGAAPFHYIENYYYYVSEKVLETIKSH